MRTSKEAQAIANGVLVRFIDASPRVLKAWDALKQDVRNEIMEDCADFVEHALENVVEERLRRAMGR